MAWLDLATSTLSVTLYSLKWSFFATVNVTLYLIQLVAWPVAALWNFLLLVVAPVVYTLRFLLSPLFFIFGNLPRLEPLYIYFGSAAFIGITFGLLLTLTTSTTFSLLGLYDKPHSPLYSPTPSAQHTQLSTKSVDDSRPITPLTPGAEQRDLDALLAGISSSPESDHLITLHGPAGWRDPPNTKRKRRSASGLGGAVGASRFSTILEEDDDSL